MSDINLLLLGAGYTAGFIARRMTSEVSQLVGTSRSAERNDALAALGIKPLAFDGRSVQEDLREALASATHIVISAAPGSDPAAVDPLLSCIEPAHLSSLLTSGGRSAPWIAYLSTIGVYGNASGRWVDESTPCTPTSLRSRQRLLAEQQWQGFADASGAGLAIFRLPGIYGPGRNALVNLHAGNARRIVKPGQVFNRAHVEDIASAVSHALLARATGVYNVCDNLPAPAQDVVEFAAQLMGIEPPPALDFDSADLSPMARSFYGENKRVSNTRSTTLPGMRYNYPDYKAGLTALWESGAWKQH